MVLVIILKYDNIYCDNLKHHKIVFKTLKAYTG